MSAPTASPMPLSMSNGMSPAASSAATPTSFMGTPTGSMGMPPGSMGTPPAASYSPSAAPYSPSAATTTGSMGAPPAGLPGMSGGRRRTRKASKTANNAKAANANAKATRSKAPRGKMPMRGSKAQVWHGTAHHTTGGLMKKDLMMTKNGRIVSRKKHALGKKALRRLVKAGYKAKKGTFKLFKRGK